MCEAGYLFHNFMNGSGIQKREELNGRSPQNESPNQRGIKIKPERDLKIFPALRAITEQNRHGFVAFYVNFKKAS